MRAVHSTISHASCVRSSVTVACITDWKKTFTFSIDASFSRTLSSIVTNFESEMRMTWLAWSGVSRPCTRHCSSCSSLWSRSESSRSPAQHGVSSQRVSGVKHHVSPMPPPGPATRPTPACCERCSTSHQLPEPT